MHCSTPPTYTPSGHTVTPCVLEIPYFFHGLRRPRSHNSADLPSRSASVTARSAAGSDLPGGRRTMTGLDDNTPAAHGPPLGARARLQHTTFCMCALRTCIYDSRIRNSLVNSHCCLELRNSYNTRLLGGSQHCLHPFEKISE